MQYNTATDFNYTNILYLDLMAKNGYFILKGFAIFFCFLKKKQTSVSSDCSE